MRSLYASFYLVNLFNFFFFWKIFRADVSGTVYGLTEFLHHILGYYRTSLTNYKVWIKKYLKNVDDGLLNTFRPLIILWCDVQSLQCWYCNKMLYNNIKAMMHIQGHIDSSKQQNIDLSDLTQCKHCYRQFDTPFEMQTHVEKVKCTLEKNPGHFMCKVRHWNSASNTFAKLSNNLKFY